MESITWVAVVYRLGNPSALAWSKHEKNTLKVALKQEKVKKPLSDSEAVACFQGCGFKTMLGIIPKSLEDSIFDRTVDLIIEKQEKGSSCMSNVQQFCEPRGVDNREVYLVSTSSCSRIKIKKN